MFRQLRTIANSKGLDTLLVEVMIETEEELLDLLRAQLEHGEAGDGQLPKYANDAYAKRKQTMGSKAPYGIVDLKLTGSFQDKLAIIMTKKGARIRSTDKKSNELRKQYSKEIFELNGKSSSIYLNEIIYPALIKKVQNELHK